MKNLVIAVMCIFLISACKQKQRQFPEIRTNVIYDIVIIDGCEYITFGAHGFSHKGNCQNPVHLKCAQ